jgi:hypothetical protein
LRFVVTDYWSDAGERPYSSVLHNVRTDRAADFVDVLKRAVERVHARDGDEIEVTITKTGKRPFGNRKVRLIGPHTFEREKWESANGAGGHAE